MTYCRSVHACTVYNRAIVISSWQIIQFSTHVANRVITAVLEHMFNKIGTFGKQMDYLCFAPKWVELTCS